MYITVLTIALTVVCIKSELGNSLSCKDVEEIGSGAKLTEADIQSLLSLSPSDLSTCLVLLGKDPLKQMQAESLWKVIIKIHGSANDIPESDLKQLGWIISGIPPNEFRNLTLTDVDTIAAFGQYRNLSITQLSALYETVTDVWSSKNEDDFSSYDLVTLKQILCAFNATYIQYIHPDAYRDAAPELATLQDCPIDIMKALARLATDESAFGNPKEWTANKVSAVGCVLSGLSNIQAIPPEAMRGITTEIKKCLTFSTIQAMSQDQLNEMNLDSSTMKKTEGQSSQKQMKYNNYEYKDNSTHLNNTYSNRSSMMRNKGYKLPENIYVLAFILVFKYSIL